MKKSKKILSGIMALCLAFSVGVIPESIAPVVSITASAEDYIYENLTYNFLEDGTIEITDCDESATEVVIPPEIDDVPVTSIGYYAFYNCDSLTSVNIPNSVLNIGEYAFSQCGNLTSITIPDSVTSIGFHAFSNCESLTSINIPDSVTSIGAQTFSYCKSLTSIKISKNITSIGNRTFYRCYNLTSVEIPDSVTYIANHAFENCESLTLIKISNNVTSIEDYAFCGCNSLTSIEIPDSVTNIGEGAFSACKNLTSVEIPNSVTSIGRGAFSACTNLKDITILNPDCEIYDDINTIYNGKESPYFNNYFDGTIYGYENSTAQAYAEKYGYKFESLGKAPETTGDINGDGDFSISDVVTIQKYILGDSDVKISDWKQADFIGDGVLDVFDLVMMRKKLIEK